MWFQNPRVFVRPSPPRWGPSGRRGSGRRLEGPRRGGDGCTICKGSVPLTRVERTWTNGLVLLSLLKWVFVKLRYLRSSQRGSRIPSGKETFWFWSLKLAQVGTFFTFFRICSAFLGFPHSSLLSPSICFHFSRFFFDFSSILGRFREVFR